MMRHLALAPAPDRYLNRDQLAERMGITPRQVTRLGLPRYRGESPNRLFAAEGVMISRSFVPPWSWFVQPSGGPTWRDGPAWLRWLDTTKRRPILAHPVGAFVVTWVFSWFWPIGAGIAAALLVEADQQYHKAIRGVYGPWLWREVTWIAL